VRDNGAEWPPSGLIFCQNASSRSPFFICRIEDGATVVASRAKEYGRPIGERRTTLLQMARDSGIGWRMSKTTPLTLPKCHVCH
jgi:hypothetical protein